MAKSMQFTTPVGRLSFPALFKAKGIPGSDTKRFGATILLDKNDPAVVEWVKKLKAGVLEVAREKWPSTLPAELAVPLKDGDTSKFEKGKNKGKLRKEVNPEVIGHWIIAANRREDSQYPHEVVDRNLEPIMRESDCYSGCNARMVFSIFAYDKGDCGVGAGLEVLQKVGDNKPFTMRRSLEEMLGKIEGGPENLDVVDDAEAIFN